MLSYCVCISLLCLVGIYINIYNYDFRLIFRVDLCTKKKGIIITGAKIL